MNKQVLSDEQIANIYTNSTDSFDFAREVIAAYEAELAKRRAGTTCEDEGCPHYGTPHSHPDDSIELVKREKPAAWINYKVKCSVEPPFEVTSVEAELGFERLAYGYDYSKSAALYTHPSHSDAVALLREMRKDCVMPHHGWHDKIDAVLAAQGQTK